LSAANKLKYLRRSKNMNVRPQAGRYSYDKGVTPPPTR
jgi:hypothetical protein